MKQENPEEGASTRATPNPNIVPFATCKTLKATRRLRPRRSSNDPAALFGLVAPQTWCVLLLCQKRSRRTSKALCDCWGESHRSKPKLACFTFNALYVTTEPSHVSA